MHKSHYHKQILMGLMAVGAAFSAAAGTHTYAVGDTSLGSEGTIAYDETGTNISSIIATPSAANDPIVIQGAQMTFADQAVIELGAKNGSDLVFENMLSSAGTLVVTNCYRAYPSGAFLVTNEFRDVLANATLDDLDVISSYATSATLPHFHGLATPHFIKRSEGQYEAQMQLLNYGWLKAAKIVLKQDGAKIVGQCTYGRYSINYPAPLQGRTDRPVYSDFDQKKEVSHTPQKTDEYLSYGPATTAGQVSVCGVNQLTFGCRNEVVIAKTLSGTLEVAPGMKVRVKGEALGAWNCPVVGDRGTVIFDGTCASDANGRTIRRSYLLGNMPKTTSLLLARDQTLDKLQIVSGRLGGAQAVGTYGAAEAVPSEIKYDSQTKCHVWFRRAASDYVRAVNVVFEQKGKDIYFYAANRGHIAQTTPKYEAADIDFDTTSGVVRYGSSFLDQNYPSTKYSVPEIVVSFSDGPATAILPAGTTFAGGTFVATGAVSCATSVRDSVPTNGYFQIAKDSSLAVSYGGSSSSDGLCSGSCDINIFPGGRLVPLAARCLGGWQPVFNDGGTIAIYDGLGNDGKDVLFALDNVALMNGARIQGALARLGNGNLINGNLNKDPRVCVLGSSPSTNATPYEIVGFSTGKGSMTLTFDVAPTAVGVAGDLVLERGICEYVDSKRDPTAIVKKGAGTLLMTGAVDYGRVSTTTTEIKEGVWRVGAANLVANANPMIVNGGTIAVDGSNTFGTLTLKSSGALTAADGATLAFADSSGVTWSGTGLLNITTTGSGQVKFGTSASALTATELARIRLNGRKARLDEDGTIIPVGVFVIVR